MKKYLQIIIFAGLIGFPLMGCNQAQQAGEGSTDETVQGSSQTNPPKALIDPCSLLSKAEVEAVLKMPVKDGVLSEHNKTLGQRHCFYELVNPIDEATGELHTRFLQITVMQDEAIDRELKKNGQTAALLFQNMRTETAVDVKIGDEAYLLHAGYLNMMKNSVFFTVMTSLVAPSEKDYDFALEATQKFSSMIAERN